MDTRAVWQAHYAFWAGLVYWLAVYGPGSIQWILCAVDRSGYCWGYTYQFRLGLLLASWDLVLLIYADQFRVSTLTRAVSNQVFPATYVAVGLIYFYCLLGVRKQRRVQIIILVSLFTIDRLSVLSLVVLGDYLGIVLVREIPATLLITYFLLGATVKESIRSQPPPTESEDALTTPRVHSKRPLAVSLIAVYAAISVAPNISIGYWAMLTVSGGLGFILGYGVFVFALLSMALTYGMWTLQRWAHGLGISFAAVGILGNVFLLLGGQSVRVWTYAVLTIMILGLIIWYLLKREAKVLFGKMSTAA